MAHFAGEHHAQGQKVFLVDKTDSADGAGELAEIRIVKTGDDDDPRRGMFRMERLGGLETIASWHLHIHRDPVGFEFAGLQHGFVAGGAFTKCDTGQAEKFSDHFARAGVVIHNHQSHVP